MLDETTIDWLTHSVCEALARDEPVGPTALTFLLRQYAATGRDDIAVSLGRGLAAALETSFASAPCRERAAWAGLFANVAVASDDPRVRAMAIDLVDRLKCEVAPEAGVRARSLRARLEASHALGNSESLREVVSELESFVSERYQPGQPFGVLDDQLGIAAALLVAHTVTGRLPYSMLADELMQSAVHAWWDEQAGAFVNAREFELNCEAASLCCGLARLHRDDAYREAAVIPVDADYRGRAERVLRSQAPLVRTLGVGAACYGLALADWLDLQFLAMRTRFITRLIYYRFIASRFPLA